MGTLILRRLAAMIPVLVLVTFGVFALLHLTPGDPIDAMMGESYDAAAKERLRAELGLDQPIYVQYADLDRPGAAGRFRALDPRQRAGDRERRLGGSASASNWPASRW